MKAPFAIHLRSTGEPAYVGGDFDLSALSRGAAVMILSTIVVDIFLDGLVVRSSDGLSQPAREFLAESARLRGAEKDRRVAAVCHAFVALDNDDDELFDARATRLAEDWPELFLSVQALVKTVLGEDNAEG